MKHRWTGSKSGRRGDENLCVRCGVIRHWDNSRDVRYLRKDVSGWTTERPECREPEGESSEVPAFVVEADEARRVRHAAGAEEVPEELPR